MMPKAVLQFFFVVAGKKEKRNPVNESFQDVSRITS